MVYTLEDYLSHLHEGQWFGFENLNGSDANKTYANLIVYSDDPKPTETECNAGIAAMQAEYDSQEYARNRASAYPPIGDQLDMIYHAGLGGDAFQAAISAVKQEYPK